MIETRPSNTTANVKSIPRKSPKPTTVKPIGDNSFVSTPSPKLRFYKQDDGNLCKL